MLMKRFGVVLVATALLLVSPCVSFSQVPGLPSFGEFGSLDFGNITVTPSAKIGYRAASVRMSFPINKITVVATPPNWIWWGPLELTIKRADLLVGAVGLEVDALSTVYLFGEAAGNVCRNVTVCMPVSPWNFRGAGNIDWEGSRLQWWLLDFGGGYRVRNNLSVLLGLRIDHFSVALDDPNDPSGTIQLSWTLFRGQLFGDIRTKMWVPYVGVALSGDAYEARFVWSPITSADVRVPLQVPVTGPGDPDQEASYSQFKSGWYLGFDAVLRTFDVAGFDVNFWTSGSYSIIRGRGEKEFNAPLFPNYEGTRSATSTFVTSSISCGLSANLDF
jgi:hypothetical protein